MSNEILTEGEFQKEIGELQEVLNIVSHKITNLYKFVQKDNSYRDTTVQEANISNNETLRQLSMLDTYNGKD